MPFGGNEPTRCRGSETVGPVRHRDLRPNPDTIFAGPNVWESSGKPRSELVTLSFNALDIENQCILHYQTAITRSEGTLEQSIWILLLTIGAKNL